MVFHPTSRQCYDWLNNQSFVKEESLTDWLLYNISNLSSKIYYKTFTRNEEAFNGSDWEWWILSYNSNYETTAYRLLVQAKKLRPNVDNYPLIHYSNKNGMQIDLLIEAAKTRHALPLYAYYSCCQPDINKQLFNINYVSKESLMWCDPCINGCFLTSALALQKNIFGYPRRKILEEELINASFGLSLLDVIFKDAESSRKFLNQLNSHFMNFFNNKGIVHNYKDLPTYVQTFIGRNRQDNLSWLEDEFRYELDDLAGVVVIDTRE
ncbi:MAG: hypothetical protein HFE66_01920 [Clostridiales bacterium]|jgi:hypothetical protein|nr:hypothetical protein [Clostridiales bacterium]